MNQTDPLDEILDGYYSVMLQQVSMKAKNKVHNQAKAAINAEIAKAVNEKLDWLLQHGHGGGNWRRLIEQARLSHE